MKSCRFFVLPSSLYFSFLLKKMWICKSNPTLCLRVESFCYKLSWPLNSIRKIVKNSLGGPSIHKLKNETKRPRGVGTCSESQPFHAHGIKEVKYVDKGKRLHMLQDVPPCESWWRPGWTAVPTSAYSASESAQWRAGWEYQQVIFREQW